MNMISVVFLLLGFAASWVAGRYLQKGAAILQIGAIAICGIAALVLGMGELMATNMVWAFGVLFVYGIIGALIFRAAQAGRGGGTPPE